MLLEIFEIKGYEISTDLDVLILDIYKKHSDSVMIRKIDVTNKDMMKKHKDVVEMLKKDGIDILPVIKADGKVIDSDKLVTNLRKLA
jgi:isopropylmalate/homocitrate/citramalate synthase